MQKYEKNASQTARGDVTVPRRNQRERRITADRHDHNATANSAMTSSSCSDTHLPN
ncbi:MAG: hypothetical protein AAB886_01085 [Patescibacteria group bacterium]